MKKYFFYVVIIIFAISCRNKNSPEYQNVKKEIGEVNKDLSSSKHTEKKISFSAEVIQLNEQAILLINERNEASYQEAIKILDKAIRLDPRYHVAYANKADILSILGKYDEAINLYEHIVENIKSDYIEIYSVLGMHYEKTGKDSLAREYYEKAITKYTERIEEKNDIIDMVNKAHLVYILDKEKGLNEIDSLIEVYPNNDELPMYKEYMFLSYNHQKALDDL